MGKVRAPISQVLHITMSFVAFSCTMENWWGNSCISHMMKYTVGWESYGEKSPIPWERYEYQFPRFTPFEGFWCIFPYYEKFMGKPMHFRYAEAYHRMGIGWEKSTHTMGKVWLSISQTFPIPWVLLHLPILWEIYGETHAFPICWSIPYDGDWMGKNHPYYGKSMIIDFPYFSQPWVLLYFPILWEIYGETHPFPIWWHRLIFSCDWF